MYADRFVNGTRCSRSVIRALGLLSEGSFPSGQDALKTTQEGDLTR